MNRTESREAAFIIAFEKLFLPDESVDTIIEDAQESCDFVVGKYTKTILTTLHEHEKEIDEKIIPNLRGWQFDRISLVCRTLLRIATAEMCYGLSPVSVAINECVELAKHFGNEDDYQFVNGVLSSIAKSLPEQEKA